MSMDTETLERKLRELAARVDALDGVKGADAGPGDVNGDAESLADAVSDLDEFRAKYEPMLDAMYADWIIHLKRNNLPLPDGYVEPEAEKQPEQQPANPTQAETPPPQ